MRILIMAGGKGERIASLVGDLPKPMIPVNGVPILELQIDCLRRQGFTDITLVTGHAGHKIHEYFRDGSAFGVSISYYHEETPLGTAGALPAMRETLGDNFVLLNGDIVFDVSLCRVIERHRWTNALATLVAHPNTHPHDASLLAVDDDGRITEWLHREERRKLFHNRVNAGIHVLSREILDGLGDVPSRLDLDRDVLTPAVASGRLYAFDTTEYIHDMGTPERYQAVCRDAASGKVEARNLSRRQKAVFLDRDGVLNVLKGHLSRWQDMELLPRAAEAVRCINASQYLAIVITNQPVVARGDCDLAELDRIHQRLEALLGAEGAYLDGIFFCPHHPDKGYPGERPEYKIDCGCRKPKPGMLYRASEAYNIDLSASFFVGDSAADIEAAQKAGVFPVFIGQNTLPGYAIRQYGNLCDFALECVC